MAVKQTALFSGELAEIRDTVHEATRGVTDKYPRSFWLECARLF